MASYENINYSIRPAKCIERKMLIELMQKLSSFHNLESYEYIGFGSTYFSDFSLVHKTLGLKNMISIEADEGNSKRFDFNIPHSCIKMKYGHSNEVLPTINWNESPKIVWLDFDGKLDYSVLADIRTVISNSMQGTLLLISVNAHPYQASTGETLTAEQLGNFRMEKIKEEIGEEKLPVNTAPNMLNLKNMSKVYRQIIDDEIKSVLKDRNGGLPEEHPNRMMYEQLINIEYQDGAKMLTVGGIIYNNHQKTQKDSAKFQSLAFVKLDAIEFNIDVPQLTYRELNHLEALFPNNIDLSSGEILEPLITPLNFNNFSDIVPLRDIKKYSSVYRYFPIFAESNL